MKIKSEKGFYIGDPCYVLSDKNYNEIWGDKYDYADGIIGIDDYSFIVKGTYFGDGVYEDEEEYSYPVDSGTIAIVPLELCDQDTKLGRVIKEEGEAILNEEDGIFNIKINGKVITIDTRLEEDWKILWNL